MSCLRSKAALLKLDPLYDASKRLDMKQTAATLERFNASLDQIRDYGIEQENTAADEAQTREVQSSHGRDDGGEGGVEGTNRCVQGVGGGQSWQLFGCGRRAHGHVNRSRGAREELLESPTVTKVGVGARPYSVALVRTVLRSALATCNRAYRWQAGTAPHVARQARVFPLRSVLRRRHPLPLPPPSPPPPVTTTTLSDPRCSTHAGEGTDAWSTLWRQLWDESRQMRGRALSRKALNIRSSRCAVSVRARKTTTLLARSRIIKS